MSETHYTIGELAELAGLTRRTVRFYVQRGLIPPPLGGGRGHYYTGLHLDRLHRIRKLQAQGRLLLEIGPILEGAAEAGPAALPEEPAESIPAHWVRIPVASGVELHLESGRFRLSPVRLAGLARAVREAVDEHLPPLPAGEREVPE